MTKIVEFHITENIILFHYIMLILQLIQRHLKKIYSNPELAKFSPRELIAELKARGYTGELKYTQTISL